MFLNLYRMINVSLLWLTTDWLMFIFAYGFEEIFGLFCAGTHRTVLSLLQTTGANYHLLNTFSSLIFP